MLRLYVLDATQPVLRIFGAAAGGGYDNKRGKGDHRHLDGREEPYAFTTPKPWSPTSNGKPRLHIGTPEDMSQRFVDAWKRAERGKAVDETNLTFRVFRHHRASASDLHRDYRNVTRMWKSLPMPGWMHGSW